MAQNATSCRSLALIGVFGVSVPGNKIRDIREFFPSILTREGEISTKYPTVCRILRIRPVVFGGWVVVGDIRGRARVTCN